MRTLVVTASDESFAKMLRDLVQSLRQYRPQPFTDLACFDVGLGHSTRAWIEQHADYVIEPGWDLPVDDAQRLAKPHLRALTARPFLPRYFPGYDVYLWIDSDAWVQERSAIVAYLTAAAQGSIAMASHDHPAYERGPGIMEWRVRRREAYFGEQPETTISLANYWNAGVFALRADAPHWQHWASYFEVGLAATSGKMCCDQLALNHAIMVEDLPVTTLPARFNWLCHLALPTFDEQRQQYCDPLDPHVPLGIIHLSSKSKQMGLCSFQKT